MKGQRGQAFILVLILLAVGALFIVPVLDYITTGLRSQQFSEDTMLEAYAADSGVQYALWELNNDPGNFTKTPLIESFPINDRMVNVTATYVGGGIYKVISTATSDTGRSTTIECDVKLGAGSMAFAVATKENMALQYTTVGSLNPGEANIHSNADIVLASCTIDGDAFAVGTITGGTVIPPGIPTPFSSRIAFPSDYSELYMAMAQDGGTHPEKHMVIDQDRSLGPLYISGNLTIQNATVTLTGTVYVIGDIRVEDSNLDGEENVVAEGNITIEQGYVRSSIIPIILCIKEGGRIYSEGPTTVDGVLYAPYGLVRLEKDVHLYGSVYGKTVDIQACIITFAKELLQGRQGLPGSKMEIISYSYK